VIVTAVAERARAECGLDMVQLHLARVGQGDRHLERGEHLATITGGPVGEVGDRRG